MTHPSDPTAVAAEAPARPLLVSRRSLLRSAGLVVGTVGATAVVAACAPAAAAPGWTYTPGSLPTAGAASGTPSPSTDPTSTAATPAASTPAAPSASPLPIDGAHDPSPADFAVPPPYHAPSATPFPFALTANDGPAETILISASPATAYGSMNFNHQVPAPTLRITEGESVHFTLKNDGQLSHSIDFHAARTPWSLNYQEVAAGATFSFDWTAEYPGVFMYHCGSAPVIMHIGDGMYGAIIVDPKAGRPAAREYVLVQGEFYGSGGDVAKMLNGTPDIVAFNGQANRYKTTPLTAKVGELVRIFIVNAGPNSSSAFHVIGALFSNYEPEGNPANRIGMHQTIDVPPGDGALVELTFAEPGKYPFVTHKFSDASKGALGLFEIS